VVAGATACGAGPQSVTYVETWQALGSRVSVAAWGKDSLALRAATLRMRDSMLAFDSAASGAALRRAWTAEREELRLQPEWRDVRDSYALDQAIPALAAVAESALVDLGGQFHWVGPATKRVVGIADPDDALRPRAGVELHAGSLSTVTGEHRSVTVLAREAFRASAWASALFPLGCARALALAPRLERRQVSVVCVDSAGVRWSTDLGNRVVLPAARVP
jgi:hypothetical protein